MPLLMNIKLKKKKKNWWEVSQIKDNKSYIVQQDANLIYTYHIDLYFHYYIFIDYVFILLFYTVYCLTG